MNLNSNKPPESQAPNRSAPNPRTVQNTGSAEQNERTAQAINATPAERVEISGRCKKIAEIMAAIDKLPETRDSKVQEIRRRVDAGTYSVDPRKVVESIIKSMVAPPRTSELF